MLNTLKKIAKDLLAITWIRRAYEATNRIFLEVFGSSRVLTHLAFLVAPLAFNREQSGTLRGRRDYYRNKKRDRQSHVELRRNIHRLEKGLIMMPRRDVFARDYITETLEFYESAAHQCLQRPGTMELSEMDWSHNVLREYFAVCATGNTVIDAARARFDSIDYSPRMVDSVPHPKQTLSSITYEQLALLAQQRRSVRFFEQRPVPRQDMD
ncbi:MAG: nitroreductase family protein, partial [Thermoleophilia bacterium]|nr:nitroreductase family protein [Thermoleophilia bacterium]